MGQKISDGVAFDAVAPAQIINDGDLYRIGGWNGIAVGAKDASQADRTMSFEMSPSSIYSIKLPAGLSPAVGDFGYWTVNDSTTFQRGDTDLVAAPPAAAGLTNMPAVHFLTTKNAAGYAQCRVHQSANLEVT